MTSTVSCGLARAGVARARYMIQQLVQLQPIAAAAFILLFPVDRCWPRAGRGWRIRPLKTPQSSLTFVSPRYYSYCCFGSVQAGEELLSPAVTAVVPGSSLRRISIASSGLFASVADVSSGLDFSLFWIRPKIIPTWRPAGSIRPLQLRHFRIWGPDASRQVSLISVSLGLQPGSLKFGHKWTK